MHADGVITRPEARPDVRLLVPALVAWAATAVALVQPTPGVVAVAVCCSLAGTALLRCDGRWWRTASGALLLTTVALVAVLGHRGVDRAGSIPDLASQGATVRIAATVTSDPRLVGGGAERPPLVLVRLTVREVTGRGATSRVVTPVVVFGDRAWLDVHLRDTVRVSGRLSAPRPGDDVAAVLAPRGQPEVVASAGPVDRAAEQVRARFREAVTGLPADARGLVPALVIGDTSSTPPDLTEAMKATSLTHLSAVSGSNVSVVLAGAVWCCSLVGVGRRWRTPVALLALAGFVVLARPEPSVVRAAVMGVVGLLAVTGGRERLGMPALGAAIAVLLVADPWLARSFGFALSSLATLGLLLFARPWGDALARRLPAPVAGLGPALAIPLAAQVMCAPVTLLLQPGVSVIGIPANLLAAPFVAPATIAGVVTAAAAVVSPTAASVLAWVAALPTLAIAQVARRGAAVPHGSLPWPEGTTGVVLLVLVTVVVVLCGRWLWWAACLHPVWALGLVAVTGATAVPTTSLVWPVASWSMVACDVGQGDGLVLRSGPGRAVVVDIGPDGDRMRQCLSRLGVRVIDALVLTHFHADHVGGLEVVAGAFPVSTLYVTIAREPAEQAEMVDRVASEHGLAPTPLVAGQTVRTGDVSARAIWPARVIHEGSVANNASIVLVAMAGPTTALLLGDVEREAAHQVLLALRRGEGELGAAFGTPGAVDVLKVAHHGSSNQDPQLVHETRAPLAVISVGADNDYGHPAPATVQALERAGARIVRTDVCGDVAVVGHASTLAVGCRGP